MFKPNLRDIKVMVWDLDGTLHVSPEAAKEMEKTFITMVAEKNENSFKEAKKAFLDSSKNSNWSKAVSNLTGKDELEVLMELEKRVKRANYAKKDKKILDLFKKLSDFRHIILTNASYSNTDSTLEHLGFSEKDGGSFPFEKIFSPDKTGVFKPNSQMFKEVLNHTKLKPQDHLMIGDSLAADILPAKRLNFRTCLIRSHNKEPDYSLKSVHEIPLLFSFGSHLKLFLKQFSDNLPDNI